MTLTCLPFQHAQLCSLEVGPFPIRPSSLSPKMAAKSQDVKLVESPPQRARGLSHQMTASHRGLAYPGGKDRLGQSKTGRANFVTR